MDANQSYDVSTVQDDLKVVDDVEFGARPESAHAKSSPTDVDRHVKTLEFDQVAGDERSRTRLAALAAEVTGERGTSATLPSSGRRAFLLTYNPDQRRLEPDLVEDWVEATAAGHPVEGRWATGPRVQGIEPGDRAFLLRQGPEPRGIIASGVFLTGVFQQPHWRHDASGYANYADVDWDTVIDIDDPLPLEELTRRWPEQHWTPQSSGTQVKQGVVDPLEQFWGEHIADLLRTTAPRARARSAGSSQGWMQDLAERKKVEDTAQERLMQHYRSLGWDVEDTRFGNSFDARATRGDERLYLEAKGTVTAGDSVIVSRREVEWALNHPGECVLGVLSGITFTPDGDVDSGSGTFEIFRWEPDDDELDARAFDWWPSDDKAID